MAALVREGRVERLTRTRVRYDPKALDLTADPNADLGVHGLVLLLPEWRERHLRSTERQRPLEEEETVPHRPRYSETISEWNGRVVRVRVYERTGRVTVAVPSTRKPIGWLELGELMGWLGATFGIADPGSRFKVAQIGIHSDHRTVRWAREKAVSLEDCRGALEQLYKRGGAMRHEFHLHGDRLSNLTFGDAVRILREGSPEAQIERALLLELDLARRGVRSKEKAPLAIRADTQSGYG